MQRRVISAILAAIALPAAALAQNADDSVFTLGQITITAPHRETDTFGDDVVTRDEMWRFDTNTLDQAIRLVPGVMATLDTNGRRNERDIFVRGFGRWQVPLSIDGVRVYLPADNRLDFSRFVTPDLAEIQIRKGYVSVLDGPGGVGGAINLVTRKPAKPFESEFQGSSSFDGDGSYAGWNGYAMVGTRQEHFYAQASGSYLQRDHWELSDDFRPRSAIEDGGERGSSDNRDWRINIKAGFVPNDTDEYTLNYTRQEGVKGAPLNVNSNPPNPPNSYWRWPWWNIENLYWLSSTAIGDDTYVRTRLYYNKFKNALDAFDDATYTTQSANGRFRSLYDDDGYGGSLEVGLPLLPHSSTRFAAHYRRDEHTELNINRPTSPAFASTEPVQTTRENTWSVAVENTYHATEAIDVLVGVSYDDNEIDVAQDFNTTQGLFDYPTGGSNALNGQASVQWNYAPGSRVSASLSSRTRFPTTFERFSTRFGTAVPSPDLGPERGVNYEIGWQGSFGMRLHASAAVFYSDVEDMIQTVVVATSPVQLTQTQNVGNGEYYGVELAGDAGIGEHLAVGGNYTYLHREIVDALQPGFRPVGTPAHQALLFATWAPDERWSISPSIELASNRWSDVAGTTAYTRVGEYALVDLQAQFRVTGNVTGAIGGRNLFDRNYELAYGLPEPGRTLYMKVSMSF